MDALKFANMLSDKYVINQIKLKHKYPEDFNEFIEILKSSYYDSLPICDLKGGKLVFLEQCTGINLNAVKLLLKPQSDSYGLKAIEDEISSTSAIESIDLNRNSIRNIMSGMAPKDEQEERILGLKKGFEFISKKENQITEKNIYNLYMMSIGNFLDDENKLKSNNYYRHDSVYVVSSIIEHSGADYKKLPIYMEQLVEFINANDNINDLLKAAIIHFYIGYIHPYFDGNGRMARLMHLWFLVQKGYSTALFVPLSSYIEKSRKKYYDAYTLVEDNYKLTGVLDTTPFLVYFVNFVYNKLPDDEIKNDVLNEYEAALNDKKITEKESKLWKFVLSKYAGDEFSTKQLEKDYGDAAYATIRSFVLKFEKLGLLEPKSYANRTKYKIK